MAEVVELIDLGRRERAIVDADVVYCTYIEEVAVQVADTDWYRVVDISSYPNSCGGLSSNRHTCTINIHE